MVTRAAAEEIQTLYYATRRSIAMYEREQHGDIAHERERGQARRAHKKETP